MDSNINTSGIHTVRYNGELYIRAADIVRHVRNTGMSYRNQGKDIIALVLDNTAADISKIKVGNEPVQ